MDLYQEIEKRKRIIPIFSNCFVLLCLLLLPTAVLMAQQPDWKWGVRGGSEGYNPNGTPFYETAEDMAVDADGNVYVVSTLGGGMGKRGPTLSGVPNNLPFYGEQSRDRGILLASYDCDGNYRWHKFLSGGFPSGGPKVATDTLGHVYLAGHAGFSTKNLWTGEEYFMHYDTDTIIPYAFESNKYKKRLFLARYDTSGNFQQLIQPEPDSIFATQAISYPQDLLVDPDGTQHFVVRAATDRYDPQRPPAILHGDTLSMGFHILKYQPDGTYLGSIPLPILDTVPGSTFIGRMARDHVRDLYYLAGWNSTTHYSIPQELVIDGQLVESQMFAAQFDALGNMVWVREADSQNLARASFSNSRPVIDIEGNVYMAGDMNSNAQQVGSGMPIGMPISFHTYTVQNTIRASSIPVIIVLNPAGDVVWGAHGETYSNLPVQKSAVTLAGKEVVYAASHGGIEWGGIVFPPVYNSGYDVFLARLNKADGSMIAMDSIHSTYGFDEHSNAIVADKRGNVFVGGEFESRIYVGNDTLIKYGARTDFFVAKHGKDNCNCNLPEAKFSYSVANGGTVHFTYTGSPNYDSLEWSFGTGQVQTTTSGTTSHTYTENGEKRVCVTAYDDSCGYDTWCFIIDPFLINIETPLDKEWFTYYPNPANEGFTLECKESLSYTLYDLTGREIRTGNAPVGATWISLENAQKGMYLLRVVNSEGAIATVKIVKK